jgi:hypothetical protein
MTKKELKYNAPIIVAMALFAFVMAICSIAKCAVILACRTGDKSACDLIKDQPIRSIP